MARIDKGDPMTSTFRVDVAADFVDANIGKLFGWGLDSTGKAGIGAGQSGICGVWVVNDKPGRVGPLREVPRIDLMRAGCVTDFGPTSGTPGVTFGVAGKQYFSDVLGFISATPGVGSVLVGQTVEPDRLEVNLVPTPLVAGQSGIATVSAWQATHAYTAGTYATVTGATLECTVAGTSAGAAPAAPAAVGGTVVDGTATWVRVL